MPSKMLKNIVVVGCGYWGQNLVRNFYELNCLYCISDEDEEQANFISSKYSVENKSFEEVIEDPEVDAVVLAVPARLHHSMSIKSMEYGKHVYVEKPIAMNELEAKEMIASSKKNNVHLMIGHLLQYHPVFVKFRELVSSGEIGEIKYIYSNRLSFGKIRSEEDVIWSFAPHDISMILSLLNKMPKRVQTSSARIVSESLSDSATLHLQFENDIQAHIFVSWISPFKEHKISVVGSNGMIVFDDTLDWKHKLILYRYMIHSKDNSLIAEKKEGKFIEVEEFEPLKQECKYFLDLINSKVLPLTDGEEGLRVLKVLTMSKESEMLNNIPVELNE